MITKDDVAIIHIMPEQKEIARYFARKRMLFEFPRSGYGNYNTRGTQNIESGIIGELAFLELAYEKVKNQYAGLDACERCEKLKGKFMYKIMVGDFDGGFEFKIGGKSVDIKTYGTRIVTLDEIFMRPYNLFVDTSQSTSADIYVQEFLLPNDNVCIAGYYAGVPPVQNWMPQAAHTCPVPALLPIAELLKF